MWNDETDMKHLQRRFGYIVNNSTGDYTKYTNEEHDYSNLFIFKEGVCALLLRKDKPLQYSFFTFIGCV